MISDSRDSVLDTCLGQASNGMPAMPACPHRFIILSSHTLRRCITPSEAHAEVHATACGGACHNMRRCMTQHAEAHATACGGACHSMRRRMLWYPLLSHALRRCITSSEADAVRTSRRRGACLAHVSITQHAQVSSTQHPQISSTQHAPTDADTEATSYVRHTLNRALIHPNTRP